MTALTNRYRIPGLRAALPLVARSSIWALCLIAVLLASSCTRSPEPAPPAGIDRPNVVLIVTDDMGYADMGTQGATDIRTPNLDRMAAEGTRFTSFYVAQPVCTASRAAFLSGSYPNRVGLQGALNHTSRNGIHPDEWLLPEMFKARGYATSGMGKWHLGTVSRFGATRNGFDEWLGIPYSNDNSSHHPVLAAEMPPLPFYDGEEIIETDPDQSQFTRRFTERAVSFLERNAEGPFFLYMPHVMPHVPIFASERFAGRSEHGLYGDVIEELDWSVGEILTTLPSLAGVASPRTGGRTRPSPSPVAASRASPAVTADASSTWSCPSTISRPIRANRPTSRHGIRTSSLVSLGWPTPCGTSWGTR